MSWSLNQLHLPPPLLFPFLLFSWADWPELNNSLVTESSLQHSSPPLLHFDQGLSSMSSWSTLWWCTCCLLLLCSLFYGGSTPAFREMNCISSSSWNFCISRFWQLFRRSKKLFLSQKRRLFQYTLFIPSISQGWLAERDYYVFITFSVNKEKLFHFPLT